jgi:hypothetical protein
MSDAANLDGVGIGAGCPILFLPFAKRVGDGTHPGSGAQKK